MATEPEHLCEVCAEEPVVGVASVPGVPISVGYGARCLAANAHPYGILVANTAMVGGYDQTNGEWQQMVDDTLARLGKTREEFDSHVTAEMLEFEEWLGRDG